MKKIIATITAIVALSACGVTGGTNTDAVHAAVNTMGEIEWNAACDMIDLYGPAATERILIEGYEQGKPDGIIWVRVDHSPSKGDLRMLVDIFTERCEDR